MGCSGASFTPHGGGFNWCASWLVPCHRMAGRTSGAIGFNPRRVVVKVLMAELPKTRMERIANAMAVTPLKRTPPNLRRKWEQHGSKMITAPANYLANLVIATGKKRHSWSGRHVFIAGICWTVLQDKSLKLTLHGTGGGTLKSGGKATGKNPSAGFPVASMASHEVNQQTSTPGCWPATRRPGGTMLFHVISTWEEGA